MNFRFLVFSLIIIFSFQNIFAQRKHHAIKAKTTVANIAEDDYNVQYVKVDLSATNLSTAISGHVLTRAKVVANSLSEYYFELTNQLTIDSAKVNGQLLPVTQINNFENKIQLTNVLSQNAVFEVDIFYHGAPAGGNGFFTVGITNQVDPVYSDSVTQILSAAYHARDWFPCKQSLTDKIDSADVWITVPTGLKVAGNGLLKNVTPMGAGFNRYEWSERYPIDYYLLSFCVAPYQEYNYFIHFNGSSDSMLIQNFVYADTSILPQYQHELDTVGLVINYFSDLFGKYPFYKEKAGLCMTPLSGGEENQTMVSVGTLEYTLIAHELSHQWWGDNITCKTIKDMWLNEGFATYCEELYLEHFWGQAAADARRTSVFNSVIYGFATTGGSVYVSDTTSEARIYNYRLSYQKGSAVLHMLRYLCDNDSLFFQVLKNYRQQYNFGNATTEDFKNVAEQTTNLSLDTFFSQWVYKEGYPYYAASWAQDANNKVVIKLSQHTSKPTSVALFKLPVEIKLTSANGDTTFRLDNEYNQQWYTLYWNQPITGLIIDPNDNILNKVDSVTNDNTLLSVNNIQENQIEIYPNPSSTSWLVKNIPIDASLILTDMEGKVIMKTMAVKDSLDIPSAPLSKGVYLLSITHDGSTRSYKLQR